MGHNSFNHKAQQPTAAQHFNSELVTIKLVDKMESTKESANSISKMNQDSSASTSSAQVPTTTTLSTDIEIPVNLQHLGEGPSNSVPGSSCSANKEEKMNMKTEESTSFDNIFEREFHEVPHFTTTVLSNEYSVEQSTIDSRLYSIYSHFYCNGDNPAQNLGQWRNFLNILEKFNYSPTTTMFEGNPIKVPQQPVSGSHNEPNMVHTFVPFVIKTSEYTFSFLDPARRLVRNKSAPSSNIMLPSSRALPKAIGTIRSPTRCRTTTSTANFAKGDNRRKRVQLPAFTMTLRSKSVPVAAPARLHAIPLVEPPQVLPNVVRKPYLCEDVDRTRVPPKKRFRGENANQVLDAIHDQPEHTNQVQPNLNLDIGATAVVQQLYPNMTHFEIMNEAGVVVGRFADQIESGKLVSFRLANQNNSIIKEFQVGHREISLQELMLTGDDVNMIEKEPFNFLNLPLITNCNLLRDLFPIQHYQIFNDANMVVGQFEEHFPMKPVQTFYIFNQDGFFEEEMKFTFNI